VRAALERSGLDHGPISVFETMTSIGLEPVPSVASLARIFRQSGVARLEPRKKARAAYRRFVYPAPNGCSYRCQLAETRMLWTWFITATRVRIAVARSARSTRSDSTAPSRALGEAVPLPASADSPAW
jgi:hypothetical protein